MSESENENYAIYWMQGPQSRDTQMKAYKGREKLMNQS
jgi:hypothetical protein